MQTFFSLQNKGSVLYNFINHFGHPAVKNLRVRGLPKVSFAAYLKAAGVDIIRAAAVINRTNEAEPAIVAAISMLSYAVKGRLQLVSAAIRRWCSLWRLEMQFAALYAA